MKYNRQKELLSYIQEKKSVSNEELLNRFNISIQTLRRDIRMYEEQGLIEKVYGGVVYKDRRESVSSVSSFRERDETFSAEKEHIGELAASVVEDGDVIFVDSGTTAYRMIRYMKNLKNVTVISHCLEVMVAIRSMSNLTGICIGGVIQHDSGTFLMDSTFYPYNYNKAFISTVGISVTRSLTNTNIQEGQMKHHSIEHSSKVYIMAL